MEQNKNECGLPGCNTGGHDVFMPACNEHDQKYAELKPWESTEQIDFEFYLHCLAIANEDPLLKRRAWIYWKLCRTYGRARYGWKAITNWIWL